MTCDVDALLLHSPAGWLAVRWPDGDVLAANRKAAELCGRITEQIVGRPWWDLLEPESAKRLSGWITQWRHGEFPVERSGLWLQQTDETKTPITLRAATLAEAVSTGGTEAQHFLILEDRRETQALAERLDNSEARLEETQRVAHLGWWEWDIKNGRIAWSDSLYEVMGIPSGEFGGTLEAFLEGVHPDDRVEMRTRLGATLKRGEQFIHEFRTLDKNGTVRHLRSQAKLSRDGFGWPVRLYGTSQDVTARTLAVQELTQSEQRFRTLFEHSPDAIFVESLAGIVLDVNPAACELHGLSREQLIGKHVMELVPPRIRDDALRDFPKLASGELRQLEGFSWHAERGEVPISLHVSQTEYAFQPALLFHVRDITERKRAEDKAREVESQLAHVGRLSLMGELMAGISHEINQPLFAIANFAKACEKTLADGKLDQIDKVLEWTHKIGQQATRAGEIIRRMRDFSRKSTPHHSTVDVGDMIHEAIELMAAETKSQHIDLTCEIQPPHLLVLADRIQIEQTLVNLLRNAYRAMAENAVGDRHVDIRTRLAEGVLTVSVRDHGHGFKGVTPEEIFNPFFTTKPDGLGLGLTISRSIIEAHRGKLWAEQNADRGATFLFTLPVGEGVTR